MESNEDGCTAVAALLTADNTLYVANLGKFLAGKDFAIYWDFFKVIVDVFYVKKMVLLLDLLKIINLIAKMKRKELKNLDMM